jgi:hypothetical protein
MSEFFNVAVQQLVDEVLRKLYLYCSGNGGRDQTLSTWLRSAPAFATACV